jgi:hypothetical protein
MSVVVVVVAVIHLLPVHGEIFDSHGGLCICCKKTQTVLAFVDWCTIMRVDDDDDSSTSHVTQPTYADDDERVQDDRRCEMVTTTTTTTSILTRTMKMAVVAWKKDERGTM